MEPSYYRDTVATTESPGPLSRARTAVGNVRLAETRAKAEDAHRLKKRSAELSGSRGLDFVVLHGAESVNGLQWV